MKADIYLCLLYGKDNSADHTEDGTCPVDSTFIADKDPHLLWERAMLNQFKICCLYNSVTYGL